MNSFSFSLEIFFNINAGIEMPAQIFDDSKTQKFKMKERARDDFGLSQSPLYWKY